MDRIGELSRNLDENDAFVIFPEGGNFTEHRRKRAIERLRRKGLIDEAEKAEQLRHVMAPKPGGVLAALTQARDADVVFVAHTGVEHMVTVLDVWRELPMDREIQMRWWVVPADEVPEGEDERGSTGCSPGGRRSTTGSTSGRPRPGSAPLGETGRGTLAAARTGPTRVATATAGWSATSATGTGGCSARRAAAAPAGRRTARTRCCCSTGRRGATTAAPGACSAVRGTATSRP